jgi:uncharacterized lipoprotein YbaY
MRVEGTVRVQGVREEAHGAITRVRVLDVSRADAAATTVGEVTIQGCALRPDAANDIPFSLEVPDLDPRRTYAATAHVDVTGSGETTAGDYLTTQHVPVTAGGDNLALEVPARAID